MPYFDLSNDKFTTLNHAVEHSQMTCTATVNASFATFWHGKATMWHTRWLGTDVALCIVNAGFPKAQAAESPSETE